MEANLFHEYYTYFSQIFYCKKESVCKLCLHILTIRSEWN